MLVTMVLATSADGKIAPVDRTRFDFGPADRDRLERCCAAADALIMGAGTLRAYGSTVPVRDPALHQRRADEGRPPQPTTVIVTATAELDPGLRFFAQDVPRVLATGRRGAARWSDERAAVWVCGEAEVDPAELAARLAAAGMERIVLLGGGRLNAWWLSALPVHRVELTVAPVLLGGSAAPTALDGPGLPRPLSLALRGCEQAAGCVFLSYEVVP